MFDGFDEVKEQVKEGEEKPRSLVSQWVGQQMRDYPNTVFIADKESEPVSIPGYMTPNEFQVFVTYFGEKKHESSDFETYARSFKPSW